MLELSLKDFSLKSCILSKYVQSNKLSRESLNQTDFDSWVRQNYDLNDPNNYFFSYRDIIKTSIEKTHYNNGFAIKIVAMIQKETNLIISNHLSLMGLSLLIKNHPQLTLSGSCQLTLMDIYIHCLLLQNGGLINNELLILLKSLKNKFGPLQIDQSKKDIYKVFKFKQP